MSQPNCVYVVGAGFSAGLGYPLTSDLLVRLWDKLDADLARRLQKLISFHHPEFDPARFTTFPNVEQLLTEMQVNEQLFDASRSHVGTFTKNQLQALQTDLLLRISSWFHELSQRAGFEQTPGDWLKRFKEQVIAEKAAIVSFNWDLILDKLLFGDDLGPASYGFTDPWPELPCLLKPHGSLNWFGRHPGSRLKSDRRVAIFDPRGAETVYAFRKFRAPRSSARVYTPLIVPPGYLKNFEKPIFEKLWRTCVELLSEAKRVVFLGYSMPSADYHVQFIMRCGFHNQVEGIPLMNGKRKSPTGPAEVLIVNPDAAAAQRISAVVGPKHTCGWVSIPVSEWIDREET